MCGIVGFSGPPDEDLLRTLNDRQRHRGPDDEGYYTHRADGISMAMRRLSIIDPAGGHQPMSSADGSVTIVFNGEIYNAPELRKDAERLGAKFRTRNSDTEVLLELYQRFGQDMLGHLNGMFAFVIHDSRRHVLFGARDHFGIKPLHYALHNGQLAFASELKSLRLLPWLRFELDAESVFDFFTFQAIPSPRTIFHRVKKLAAAHCFEFDLVNRTLAISRYWNPPLSGHTVNTTEDLEQAVRSEFEAAVKRWTLSDVPIACSLSGGIDSSAMVAVLAQGPGPRLRTYSLGFSDSPEIDETSQARAVAHRWETDHHEIVIQADDLLSELDGMMEHLDEPYAGGLPSWFVFRAMSRDVKVGMTGTGGDELFGNYGKWKIWEAFPSRLRGMLRYVLRRGGSIGDLLSAPHGALHYPYFTDAYKRSSLLLPPFAAVAHSSARDIERLWRERSTRSSRDAVAAVDLNLQLPEEFLFMTDRFSMAHSIEARTPFLDRRFAEFVLSIPARQRTNGKSLKSLFINSCRDLLIPEILSSPKRGFVLPMGRWMKGRLAPQIAQFLDRRYLQSQGVLRADTAATLVRNFEAGDSSVEWQLWTLLMFQCWYERCMNNHSIGLGTL